MKQNNQNNQTNASVTNYNYQNNQNSNYPTTRDKSFSNYENMENVQSTGIASAMNTFDSIPNTSSNALEIVAVQKSNSQISGYQLSNGQIVSKNQALEMAKNGEIRNVGVATNQGNEYLRSLPDSTATNNLDNLPIING